MKTLVTRSLALLLTLALLFTVTPFTALAEAAENEDGMDEIMDILETYAEETEASADPSEALTDSTEETVPAEDASEEDQPIEDDSEETAITDEKPETSDLPEMPEEVIILDDPGVEDDWANWYADDQPEEESEEAGDDWPETDDALSEEDAGEDEITRQITSPARPRKGPCRGCLRLWAPLKGELAAKLTEGSERQIREH